MAKRTGCEPGRSEAESEPPASPSARGSESTDRADPAVPAAWIDPYALIERRRQRLAGEEQERRRRAGIRETTAFCTALKRYMKAQGLDRPKRQIEIAAVWDEVVGPEIAAKTDVQRLHGGILTVTVEGAALRSELENFHHQALLQSLREACPNRTIRKIRFRAGVR